MGIAGETFSWNADVDDDLLGALYARELVERSHTHLRARDFASEPWTLDNVEHDLGIAIARTSEEHGTFTVLGRVEVAGGMAMPVLVRRHGSRHTTVSAASDDLAALEEFIARVVEALKAVPHVDPRVPVTFWTMSAHGPRPMPQMIDAPEWDDIAGNYHAAITDELERAMRASADTTQGIALWWGEPGTGKTTALRALARAWKDWCEVHVIIDPEVFLGSNASYLIDVLMSHGVHHYHAARMMAGTSDGDEDWDDEWDDDDAYPSGGVVSHAAQIGSGMVATPRLSIVPGESRPLSKLIVLEDAGELVSADARHASGQALSRLLNITDGMLGQGLNLSVLVTTNEQVGDLHPAIQRPGRCWSQVEFPALGQDAASAWLQGHGAPDVRVDGDRTLAELFALLRGTDVELDDLERPPSVANDYL